VLGSLLLAMIAVPIVEGGDLGWPLWVFATFAAAIPSVGCSSCSSERSQPADALRWFHIAIVGTVFFAVLGDGGSLSPRGVRGGRDDPGRCGRDRCHPRRAHDRRARARGRRAAGSVSRSGVNRPIASALTSRAPMALALRGEVAP
jgi:hypothetical protein